MFLAGTAGGNAGLSMGSCADSGTGGGRVPIRYRCLVRDPHVVSLHYRLVPSANVTFAKQAEPVEAEADGFRVRLADEALVVEMLDHHGSDESAREAVERYLRAWEIRHALRVGGEPEFRFEFQRAEVIDRDPPPPGTPQTVAVSGHISASSFASATLGVERGSLPAPPSDFELEPDVETLWARWRAYQEGREPLQSMAYFALTVLERHGGRRPAAARFGVSEKVLKTLGELVSERGDATTARKAKATANPLMPNEHGWIEAAVLALVRRAGEVAADPSAAAQPITMDDLPSL